MKKLKLFALIALAMAACACNKEKEIENTPKEQEPVGPVEPGQIVFTAQAPTKTSIDANDEVVSWVAGDEVKFVWDGGSTTAAAASSGASTTFTIDAPEGADEIYAVYPVDACGSYSEGKVGIHFNSSNDEGSFAAGDLCVARAVKSGDNWGTTLAFKNVACLIKVGVTSSEVIKVKVETVGGEIISGYVPVSLDNEGTVSYGAVASGLNTVSVPVSGPGSYYIPVLPDVTLENGFRVNRYISEEDQLTPFCYNGSFTTVRGNIIKLDDIDAHAGQYYVTPDGAGTKSGQSWNNAMDAASFKAFIENADNYFILRGSVFHLSAGEFTFGDYLQPKFSEHGEVAFTIEGTKSGSDITTFKGGSGDPAGMLWPQANTNVTVKNVKFTGTNGNSNRGAIRLNTSSAKLTLENCIFENNMTSGHGGAIVLFKCAALDIKDCDFINNSGGCGAGIFFEAQLDLTVNVSGGTFEGNSATGSDDTSSAGAVFYASSNGGNPTLNFTGVTFKSNYCNSGSNDNIGGILRLQTANGKATFNNCTFDGNYSYRTTSTNPACAALINCRIDGPAYYFNACEIKNNASGTYGGTGSKYGMVIATLKAITLAMNNCSIHDNYGGRNTDPIDWIYIDNAGAKLILSNSSVVGDPSRKTGASAAPSKKNGNGVFYLNKDASFYFVNNILCSPTGGKSLNCTTSITIESSYYNKTSPVNGTCNWGSDTGSGHDYNADETCFGNWSGPFTWNGTMTGTNSDMKAATADVNSEIQTADADFYAWLNEIGALGKDINGKDRGTTSWPGCYQN